MQKKAVILLSGGLDSTTCLALAKEQGFSCYALSFAYGQKHSVELVHAKRLAEIMGVVSHNIVNLPLSGSSLTDNDKTVNDFVETDKIPNTYVPARNTIFLAIALGWAEVLGAQDIFIGANVMDYSNYPDCRPEFLRAFEKMATLGTKMGAEGEGNIVIHAPLLSLNKAQIIAEGIRLGVDYKLTVSCYRATSEGKSCGTCDSCAYRKKGFTELGVPDPTVYV